MDAYGDYLLKLAHARHRELRRVEEAWALSRPGRIERRRVARARVVRWLRGGRGRAVPVAPITLPVGPSAGTGVRRCA